MMDFRRKCLTLAVAASVALTVGAIVSWAGVPVTRAARPTAVTGTESVLSLDNQRRVDVNNLNMFVTNYGSWAYDLSTGNSGLVYPKGTDKTAIFAGGLWFGAEVNGEVRATVAVYGQEYGPGVILRDGQWTDPAQVWDDAAKPEYRVYKVARWTGTITAQKDIPSGLTVVMDSTFVGLDSARVERAVPVGDLTATDPLVHHSWSEYMAGAVPLGAPWKNYRLPDPNSPGVTA
jgi:hypothetical protein